jgi:hypothetical protein
MSNCLAGINQPPFSFEEIKDAKAPDGVHYRIRDAADNRMATCYERSNAERIVRLMNRGAGYVPSKEVPSLEPVVGIAHVLVDVQLERLRQEKLKADGKFKWTCADNHWTHNGAARIISLDRKLSVLSEEFGEVSNEVVEYGITEDKYAEEGLNFPPHRVAYYFNRIRKELIQVAAVAVAWCEAIDKSGKLDVRTHEHPENCTHHE